jgi:hypothetical protein
MRERAAERKLAKAEAQAAVAQQHKLQISTYDRTASWLIALLVSLGVGVFMLVAIWMSDRLQHREVAVPVELSDPARPGGKDGGNGRPAGGSQLDFPSESEWVGNDATTSEIRQNLNAMGATLASNAFDVDDPSLAPPPKRQGAFGTGGGIYGGFGDGRGWGHGEGAPGHPRNWEVVFQKGATLESYAKQLDYFKIELGVLRDKKVYYAFNLHKSKPNTRIEANPAVEEKRYWLRWTQGDLRKADEELLARAGIDPEGHIILKFLPPALEAELVRQELAKAGGDYKRIKKTRFAVKQDGERYEFYIVDQVYKW